MTAGEKYANVLKLKKKKTYKAEDELGFGRNTLLKAISEDRELTEEYHNKFIKHYDVNPMWWEAEKGDVFLGNITKGQKPSDNKENGAVPPAVYRDLVEANSIYTLVPKTILDGEYRIELKSEIEQRNKERDELIAAQNKLIKMLEDEIAMLRAAKPSTVRASKQA